MSKSSDGGIRDEGGAIVWSGRPVYLDVIQHTRSSCKIFTISKLNHAFFFLLLLEIR